MIRRKSILMVVGWMAVVVAGCYTKIQGPTVVGPIVPPLGAFTAADCGPYADWETSEYVLPYPAGESYTVLEGNCSNGSHVSNFRHAYDFRMPIGSEVVAVKAGRVSLAREKYADEDQDFQHWNGVRIDHDDGTASVYGHLTRNGVLVEVGDWVEQGQTIGFSGNSGFSFEPHLEFLLLPCADVTRCTSLPVTFANTRPNESGLVEGVAYRAKAH